MDSELTFWEESTSASEWGEIASLNGFTKTLQFNAQKCKFMLLDLIYRHSNQFSNPATLFEMYISLVCPNLEYASQVWKPYKVG